MEGEHCTFHQLYFIAESNQRQDRSNDSEQELQEGVESHRQHYAVRVTMALLSVRLEFRRCITCLTALRNTIKVEEYEPCD